MAKKSPIDELIQIPTQVTAPVIVGEIDHEVLRRQKVRELHRQGFDTKRISMILEKGVKSKDNKTIFFPCEEKIIKRDIVYISQEEIAESKDYLTKRTELLSKLDYLYNQAMISYRNAKERSPVKVTFLRTAVDILNKISEVEGLSVIKAGDTIGPEDQISSFADEIRSLPKEQRNEFKSTIAKVLDDDSEQERHRRPELLPKTPGIPAQTSSNEGISGKPKVYKEK